MTITIKEVYEYLENADVSTLTALSTYLNARISCRKAADDIAAAQEEMRRLIRAASGETYSALVRVRPHVLGDMVIKAAAGQSVAKIREDVTTVVKRLMDPVRGYTYSIMLDCSVITLIKEHRDANAISLGTAKAEVEDAIRMVMCEILTECATIKDTPCL